MNVQAIVEDYLRANGYEGLCCDECGCGLRDDIMPCDSDRVRACSPAYWHTCPGCPDNVPCEGCESEGHGEGCWRPFPMTHPTPEAPK
jgi:hypothetical protein